MRRLSEVDQAIEGSNGTNQAGRDVIYNFAGIPVGGMREMDFPSVTPITLAPMGLGGGYLDHQSHNPQILHSAQVCQSNREDLLELKKDVFEIRTQASAERKAISDMVLYVMVASFGTALITGVNFLLFVSHF